MTSESKSIANERNKRDSETLSHLPRDVMPLNYTLEIQPLMEESQYRGRVLIKLECQEDTDKITIHAHETLEIDSSKVELTPVANAPSHTVTAQTLSTEPPTVAPVPVGAARLVPVSSSFVPENACTSSHCSTGVPHNHEHNVNQGGQEGQTAESHSGNSSSVTPVQITKVERNFIKQWLVVHVGKHLQRGEQYILEVFFAGQLTSDPQNGIYIETYTDLTSREKRAYVATQMRQENSHKVYPCFDEPSYKVPMQVTVLATNQFTVLSNMPEESSDERGDWVGHRFKETPPMATFSLAFAIFNVKLLTYDVADDAPLRIYGRNELSELPSTERGLKAAVKAVEEIKEYLMVPLPVPKIDFVVLPGANSHAEANWGLIFLRESHLTCQHCLIQQVVRDVAQQWIGHLVTPHFWDNADMSKALSSFLGFTAQLKIDNSTTPDSRLWSMNYPMYYEFGKRAQLNSNNQKHPYRAVQIELVLRMFNFTMSHEIFRSGVQHFVASRQHRTFLDDDVWSALTLVTGPESALPEPSTANLIAFSWLHVLRVPYIKITRDYDKLSAEVEQHAFYRDVQEDESEADDDMWWIPLVVVSQRNLTFDNLTPKMWMEEEPRVYLNNLPSSSYFIIVNPEEVGPFIVNYDRKNWFLISEYLDRNINNEQIPAGTRGKLVHDALNLAFGGKLRFDSALNMTRFLLHERDAIVWLPAFNMFDHILRQLEGTQTANQFQEYIKIILTPAYEALSNKTGLFTAAEERMLSSGRAALCATGYPPCVKEARSAWKIWMNADDPDSGIPINLSHFCWVFKFGSQDEWEFGLERYKRYPPHLKQTDRYYLLKSLVSCPNSSANIVKLLNMTLLHSQDDDADNNISFLLSSLSSDVGYKSLINLLDENWDLFKQRYDSKLWQWEYIISTATMNFKTQEGYELVAKLAQRRHGAFGKAAPIIEQALRQIKRHVKWIEDHGIIIDQWLDSYMSRWRSD